MPTGISMRERRAGESRAKKEVGRREKGGRRRKRDEE